MLSLGLTKYFMAYDNYTIEFRYVPICNVDYW